MSEKTIKIIYWVATGLMSVMLLMTVGNSIFNHEMFSQKFVEMGYPARIIYPLAIVRILGLIAVWSNKSKTLKEWAYAGFLFEFVLAIDAHMAVSDGGFPFPLIALILLLLSYNFGKRIVENNQF